jgi:hypothetical protein
MRNPSSISRLLTTSPRHASSVLALGLAVAALPSACSSKGSTSATSASSSSSSAGGGGASCGAGGAGGAAPATLDVGSACAGTCEGGLCFPGPGGYCTASCGNSAALVCPGGSACISTLRAGDLCLKSCAAQADCRAGYACDPVWKVCAPGGFTLSPKLAACAAPALGKKAFGPAEQLSQGLSAGDYDLEPSATLAPDGGVTTFYMVNRGLGQSSELAFVSLDPQGASLGQHPFTSDRSNDFDTWMATDRQGVRYAVYMALDALTQPGLHSQIQLVTSSDGLTWSAPVAADDAADDCPGDAPDCYDKPMVAIGPDKADPTKDVVYVLYFSDPAAGMRVTRSTDGGKTFSTSDAVGAGAYGDVRATADGDLHVVMVAGNGDPLGGPGNSVQYLHSGDGGKTFTTTVASKSGEPVPFFFSNPHLAIDEAQGTLHVVYASGLPDGAWNIELATSKDGGATWSEIQVNDDAPCASHITPTAVVDPATGQVHVAWSEDRDGKGALAYAVCDADGKTCGANERISDAPFAAYQLVRFSRVWLGEYNQLVLDPTRKVLHAIWTQPVAECGAPVARIFHASRGL